MGFMSSWYYAVIYLWMHRATYKLIKMEKYSESKENLLKIRVQPELNPEPSNTTWYFYAFVRIGLSFVHLFPATPPTPPQCSDPE